jgi:murein endopeptidase
MIRWGSSLASGVWILRIFYPDGRFGTFSLSGGKLQIGADAGCCGLVISGQGVAERHCSLTERQGKLILTDNGAHDGTWLNGQRLLEPAELRAGDRLRIGDHLLELTAARPRLDPKMIAFRLQHVPIPWRRSPEEVAQDVVDGLREQAGAWNSAGRPRRGLMRGDEAQRLATALGELGRTPDTLDDPLRTWLGESRRYRQLRRAVLLCATLLLIGTAAIAQAVRAGPEDPTVPPVKEPASTTGSFGESSPTSPQAEIEHVAVNRETLQEVARLYRVQLSELVEMNEPIKPDDLLREGQVVRVPAEGPAVHRWEERRLIEENETWSDLADQYGIPEEQLKFWNESLSGSLQPGDEVTLWVPEEQTGDPSTVFEPPAGGVCVGGGLEASVQLPDMPQYYARRCPYNAYGTSTTINYLVNGLARFHERTHYQGEIVVGDLSRRQGGRYGPHKSHQSGRDVDIWLPVRARSYVRGCRSCGTEYCRPESDAVDWRTTWQLIRELAQDKNVEVVFLDWALQEQLHEAARKQGMSAEELKRWIQWPKIGRPALVQHSSGHTRHMHVRFRHGEHDIQCGG